ncbi:hypothetical protein [Neorhizobium galegae]|uniref:hypothetical protein n=1 Tax=Neorhizobium galegae TaxID=399 RepID=UPI0006221EEB|nr:hypothetical protein [Neorhizobium galegae]CDZ50421.1 Hypothetical protein NGAL_HAMBI2427_36390 [Neorhizobium galegae bv. orientalis]
MPTYEVDLNGQTFEIEAPDEASLSVAVKKLQSDGGSADKGNDPGGWSVDNVVRSLGRGVLGVGSYLDEANAATNATLAPIVDPLLPDSFKKLPGDTWGDRYNQALDIQRGKDDAFDAQHPIASTGLKIAGGVGSGIGLVKAAPAIGNIVLGNGGRSLPAKVAATVGAGGSTGFVQGFGAGEDGVANRLRQAGLESVTGAGAGLVMMPVAAGVNAGVKAAARGLIGESDDALSSMTREGRNYVTKELADPEQVGWYRTELDRLGPDAMLADVSPDWQGVARGAAARPGTRGMIVDPLNERSAMANTRLRGDVEATLGPDPIPSAIDREIGQSQEQVGRQYAPIFAERSPFDFTPITDDLDRQITTLRGDAQRQLQRVRGMLNEFGGEGVTSDPSVAFQTRQAIDGVLATEQNPKVINALTDARQMIDDALTRSVPRIKEVDASFSELARQREALATGRPILNNEASAMRPVELQEALVQGAQPQGMQVGPSAVPTRMRQAALGEVHRAIGTKANDTTALRNIVRGEGDWNREKLGLLFGQDNADRALAAIDRETVFGDTANRVTRGSDTAMGTRFTKFLDDIENAQDIPGDTTLTGLGTKAARSIIRSLTQAKASADTGKVAEEVGRLSVAQANARDEIIEALMKRGKENVLDQQRLGVISAILQSGGRSAYPSLGVR